MKRLISALVLFVFPFVLLSAQDIKTGTDFYYYNRYVSAENFFHDYLKQEPASGEAWLWLVRSYLKQDKWNKSNDSLSQAPASLLHDPYYLAAKGDVYLSLDKKDSAFLLFNEAIDVSKSRNSAILNAIAEAQLVNESGNLNYGLDALQKALKKDKNNALLYVTMGDLYLKMHNGSEAYKAYSKALEKDKNYAAAYYQMGELFLSQKNPEMYLDYFNKATQADQAYGPAWFQLYSHYLYTDPAKAMIYFKQYEPLSDEKTKKQYAYTDLLYLNKNYSDAIAGAKSIIADEGDNVQARLYKLIAYSYGELKDTTQAISSMQKYFMTEKDSNLIAKDFETMAKLYESQPGMVDSVTRYYEGAIDLTTDIATLQQYYKELATLARTNKDYGSEALWLGKYYSINDKSTNLDLFNWGLASYRAGNYIQADSVFGLYTTKYPEQGFGYYWRARSNAAIDTALTEGLAIPHYEKLVAVISDDTLTATNKKWMLEAYSYLAAYETNTEKDYKEAIDYFDKILEIDPENDSAKKYIAILEQNLKKGESAN